MQALTHLRFKLNPIRLNTVVFRKGNVESRPRECVNRTYDMLVSRDIWSLLGITLAEQQTYQREHTMSCKT